MYYLIYLWYRWTWTYHQWALIIFLKRFTILLLKVLNRKLKSTKVPTLYYYKSFATWVAALFIYNYVRTNIIYSKESKKYTKKIYIKIVSFFIQSGWHWCYWNYRKRSEKEVRKIKRYLLIIIIIMFTIFFN